MGHVDPEVLSNLSYCVILCFPQALHSLVLFSTFDFKKLMSNKCFFGQEIDTFTVVLGRIKESEEFGCTHGLECCYWKPSGFLQLKNIPKILPSSPLLHTPHSDFMCSQENINNICKGCWHTSASCNSVPAGAVIFVGFRCNFSSVFSCHPYALQLQREFSLITANKLLSAQCTKREE